MRSIWNLPWVTSLTQASNDPTKVTPPGSPTPGHVAPKPGRSLERAQAGQRARANPDVKRVHSFANRRRNK